MRSPELNVPEQVRPGLDRVLRESANTRNRQAKWDSFCSDKSEDAITWTMFSFLHAESQLGAPADAMDFQRPEGEAEICLWGVPLNRVQRVPERADYGRHQPKSARKWPPDRSTMSSWHGRAWSS